jgi:hypothetical protein
VSLIEDDLSLVRWFWDSLCATSSRSSPHFTDDAMRLAEAIDNPTEPRSEDLKESRTCSRTTPESAPHGADQLGLGGC